MSVRAIWLAVFLTAISCGELLADTFGSGANQFSIDFVTIGNPGNPPDTTGNPSPPYPTGSVPYSFRIGKYEISEEMIDRANALGGLGITKDTRSKDKPATSVSWEEAARFVNWLNTSTGSPSAYKFYSQPGDAVYYPNSSILLWEPGDAGYNPNNLYRNSLARYFLPSIDEWYKAAYFDPRSGVYYDYPTGSNSPPTPVASGMGAGTAVTNQLFSTGPADITMAGGLSPYGTMAQGGNVREWEETDYDLLNGPFNSFGSRDLRGGYWVNVPEYLNATERYNLTPGNGYWDCGFRVASVPIPEPTSLALISLTTVMLGAGRYRTRRS